MKKLFILLAMTVLSTLSVQAQTVPHGMKYQAVARDLKGDVIVNASIQLRVILLSQNNGKSETHYSEVHDVTTNALGLFTLTVGDGKAETGDFDKVPWSESDIWMEIQIRAKGEAGFTSVSNSQLLAVPYAFHAITANRLADGSVSAAAAAGVPAAVWSVKGNSATDPATDKIGTTDYVDLVFVTNNIERLRITKDGNINLANSLNVGNNLFVTNNTEIGNDLTVRRNVNLNTTGGSTTNNGPFTVANGSATSLSGSLTVTGATDLKDKLDVTRATHLKSSLLTDSAATINGLTTINNKLNLVTNDTAYVALFQNTNGGNGDGIRIKLGKTHPRWNGSAYANVPNVFTQGVETQLNQIRDWVYGNDNFSWDDMINLMPSQWVAGTVCNLTNLITDKINTALNLPLKIGPYSTPAIHIWDETTIFGGISFGELGSIPPLKIPALNIPSVPMIPELTVMPRLPQLNCDGLPTLTWPVLQFTNVDNSLTKDNEFVTFVDKANRKLGAIRAQSIENFSYDYFDGQKLLDISAQLIGIDIVKDFMGILSGLSQMTNDYNNIGVEYSSGNGDYAEWLERANPAEHISYGDIVGVRGGKITRDIAGAEQIMAVSKQPIVLGNVPDKARVIYGNNIAFMGQIPVKVTGPVRAGDYIIAHNDIPGYGIAIHPADMKVDDFKLAVGRSWDTNEKEGPKMVNTVVGVHNHDFLNIISALQFKAAQTDERLKAIEAQLLQSRPAQTEKPKKAFR